MSSEGTNTRQFRAELGTPYRVIPPNRIEDIAMEANIDPRIGWERREVPIRELNLNGNNTHIRSFGSLRRFNVSNLEQLNMVNMRMTGLQKVPRMPRLETLDLSNNRISENLHKLYVCPKLMHLNLSRNKIKTIETLEPLKNLKYLQSLDLFGNDVIFVDNYRQKVFNLIKTLKYLDGSIKEIEEE